MSCVVVRAGQEVQTQQRVAYFPGISQESAGAKGVCMHLLTIPPGGQAKAHAHAQHETAIYVLSGRVRMRYGEGLREVLDVGPGDFLYIPAGVPHLPVNLSETEPAVAVVARTDPKQEEDVVLRPELDAVVEAEAGPGPRLRSLADLRFISAGRSKPSPLDPISENHDEAFVEAILDRIQRGRRRRPRGKQ